MEMYKPLGTRSGTWLTEKEEAYKSPKIKGISNYGLVPAEYKNAEKDWKKTRKEIRQGFRRLRENAATASKKAGKKIKNYVAKNPGYVAAMAVEALGWGAKYLGADGMDGIADGLITLGFGPAVGQYVSNANLRRNRKAEKEKMDLQRKHVKLETEIRDLLRKTKRTPVNGKLNEKISYKGEMEILLKTLRGNKYMKADKIEKIREHGLNPLKDKRERLYNLSSSDIMPGNNVG